MKKEMLINVLQPEECRIAVIEDGVLEELYVERTSHESYTGNIYKGKIVNIEPAIQAAFVDFSVGRNGFLHVSDVEPQYMARGQASAGEADTSGRGRERERRQEPRRERERGRGREPRRRAPRAEPLEPTETPPPPPPRLEERRGERPREPQRERDSERGRQRERPDQSIRGRRDRSEPPARRFGEGLVEQPDFPPRAPAPPNAATPELPADVGDWPAQAPSESTASEPLAWQAPPEPAWEEISWQREATTEFPARSEEAFEGSIPPAEPTERREDDLGQVEPFDPDLPPSRTQRTRATGRPGGPGGSARGRRRGPTPPPPEPQREDRLEEQPEEAHFEHFADREPSKGKARPHPSPPPGHDLSPDEPEAAFGPEAEPAREPDDQLGPGPFEETLPFPEPPRRRGGRAAIRSRGAEWVRPRDLPQPPDSEAEALTRAPSAPGEQESQPGQTGAPGRAGETGRRRVPQGDESVRERDRPGQHARAGEPGYVPRRERLRGAETTPDDLRFAAGLDWPQGEISPEVARPLEPPTAERTEDDDSGFGSVPSTGRAPGSLGPEGRRRRRRRGRRREREQGPAGFGTAQLPAYEEVEPDFEDEAPASEPSRAFGAGLGREEQVGPDLDDLELDELGGPEPEALEADEFVQRELPEVHAVTVRDEIDAELEEEIRKEIEEIEELEREMGLRGPAEARPRRGDELGRGARPARGRGLAKPPIQDIFRRGDEVLVQVIKESIGTKGPTLSTYISIPGRYLVLMPGLNRVGVSRKIIDESQRRKLREIMQELNPPKGLGFIVRTAGVERTKRELARDLAYLLRLWKVILRRIKKSKAPTPIYQESDMIIRTIRDIFTSEIDTIWIDEPSAFERAQDFLRVVMPRFVNRLKLYDEKVPLFHRYGIEDEIAKIQRRHVPLPEGGSIVIDQTEALVAIDVNSGNFRVEDDAEKTAYEMNLRAAKEIARQLRLRDLGGVIVNDFIDMREERHRRGVERTLREAIRRDRARTKVLRMSAFGLIEMTRQRIRPSLKRSIYEDCRQCAGAGVVKTAESMAIDVMRLLALATHREEIRRVVISVAPGVASYLGNRKRREIARIEAESHVTIQIGFEQDAAAERLQIDCYDANGNEVRLLPLAGPGHKRGH